MEDNLTVNQLIGALASFNGDPFLVEDVETAQEILDFVAKCDEYALIDDKDADYTLAKECLDLCGDYTVGTLHHFWVHNGASVTICLDGDWQ